ncbi:MAG: thioesterase family protein [Steroidobacteraceae bacterium]
MFPWLRMFGVGCRVFAQSKVDLLATTRVRLRVWPNDLDLNFHVNNGRYLTLADIGRLHWFVRIDLFKTAVRHKAFPIVGDAIAKFRRDLKVFQRFEIHSRLVAWDSKWGFVEHRFVRHNRVIGVVLVRGVFKGPDGPIETSAFLADRDPAASSPELPDWANHFHRSSELLSETLREEERSQGLRQANE